MEASATRGTSPSSTSIVIIAATASRKARKRSRSEKLPAICLVSWDRDAKSFFRWKNNTAWQKRRRRNQAHERTRTRQGRQGQIARNSGSSSRAPRRHSSAPPADGERRPRHLRVSVPTLRQL